MGNNLTLRHLYFHHNMQGFFNATRPDTRAACPLKTPCLRSMATAADADNQTVPLSLLANPTEYDFRIAKPGLGSTHYAAFGYEHPAASVGRTDANYGAYAPDFRPEKN